MDANVSHNQFQQLASTNWRLDPAHAPAGMMTAVGIHLTDLLVNFTGPASEVRAQTSRTVLQPPAEDFVTASIAFKSGARATVTSLSVTPFYSRFSVFGEAGWVEVTNEANVDQNKPTTLTRDDRGIRSSVVFQAVDAVTLNFQHWGGREACALPFHRRTAYREHPVVRGDRQFFAARRSTSFVVSVRGRSNSEAISNLATVPEARPSRLIRFCSSPRFP
jgi:predicted dehydrogenase